MKSLDHQAVTFKANDLKFLRSKAIIQQIENIYDEVGISKLPLNYAKNLKRQDRMEKGGEVESGPHIVLE